MNFRVKMPETAHSVISPPAEAAKRTLSPQDKVRMATAFYLGERQSEVAARYNVSPLVVHRAIDEVKRKGWVRITVESLLELPSEPDAHFATRLAGLPGVSSLFVLKAPQRPKDRAEQPRWSDDVHCMLGRYLGKHHIRHAIVDGERLGVSSGRSVYHAIRSLLDGPSLLGVERVHLSSLSGSFGMRDQSGHDPTLMDADKNLGLLAQAFSRVVNLQTCGRGIALQGGQRPACLEEPLTRGLVGIGVLEHSNRLFSDSGALRPLRGQLDELQKLVAEATIEPYVPCADMANSLFWVPPPKGRVISQELRLRKLIDAINEHLCVVPFGNLKKAEHGLWVAAGTPRKAHAVLACLQQGFRMNALCIDSTLAQVLEKIAT